MRKLENAPILKSHLIPYRYDLSIEGEKKQYEQVCDWLERQGVRKFDVAVDPTTHRRREAGVVHLDGGQPFSDQWNTTSESPANPDCRVFHWFEEVLANKDLKVGYYVTLTNEMRRHIESDVLRCGYCASLYWASEVSEPFCTHCLGSEYLKEDDLKLLRLRPVAEDRGGRPELSGDEYEDLSERFLQAQQNRWQKVDKPKLRKRIEDEFTKAKAKRDGMMWVVDNDINPDNVIYYDHKGVFCFGWDSPLSDVDKQMLREKLQDFPFEYELR